MQYVLESLVTYNGTLINIYIVLRYCFLPRILLINRLYLRKLYMCLVMALLPLQSNYKCFIKFNILVLILNMHVCFLYVVIFIYVFCTINIKFSLKKKKKKKRLPVLSFLRFCLNVRVALQ
jgi:hypothetical protein